MADTFILKVTAGPNYKDQTPVAPNTEQPQRISTAHATVDLQVRIQNYRGEPSSSPSTSPYFSTPGHEHDLFSLSFTLTPKRAIPGHDLVLGNDFDHPIRDRLPPGFGQAFKAATWFIDPGLYGDVHADAPYLYSPLLSGINALRIGGTDDRERESAEEARANAAAEDVEPVREGADGDGAEVRSKLGLPEAGPARQKYFLQEAHLKDFTFEKDREYAMDFYNPYLDFNDFALRLPSFGLIPSITIPIISYWDGQPLRYVLKNRTDDETIFVVVFTLHPKDEEAKKEIEVSKQEKPAESTSNDDLD